MERNLFIILLGIFMSLCAFSQTPTTGITPHTPNYSRNPGFTTTDYLPFVYTRYKNNTINKLPFRILLPKNYNPADFSKVYPLIFMLHGRGEAGTDNNYHLFWGGKMHLDARNRTTNPIDAFVVFPQEPFGQWTNAPYYNTTLGGGQVTPHLEMTWELADSLQNRYRIDKNRIYIHGLSSGGTGVWASLYWRPNLFAAAQPMSAPGDTSRMKYIANIPIWLHQGGVDTNPIPYISHLVVDALRKAGAIDTSLKYSEYPNVGHSCWTLAYAQPDFFPFFFRHSKRKLRVLGVNPYCPGEAVTLGFSYNMNQYEWYKDNQILSGKTAPNLEGINQDGYYFVKFKRTAASAWESSDTIHVYQNAAAPKPTVTASGSTILPAPDANKVILKAPKGYAHYEWSTGASIDSAVLSSNATVTMRVRASTGCWSLPSDPILVRVGPNSTGTPQAATNLYAVPRSSASIELAWSDNANNELGYEVYRSFNANGPYKFLKLLNANTVAYVDTFLTASTRYYYKVRVFNANGANMSTNYTFTNTYNDLVAPSQPTGLKIESVDEVGGLTLTWNVATDNVAIKEYRIMDNATKLGTATTNKIYLQLNQGAFYSFKVLAVDYSNNLSVSSDVLLFKYDGKGLVAKLYEDNWNAVPNYAVIKPTAYGLVDTLKMSGSPRVGNIINKLLNGQQDLISGTTQDLVRGSLTDYFSLRFTGYIQMTGGVSTTFYLKSDDGSKLYVNNQLVVNNDGNHDASNEKSGSITLSTGWYPFEVQYYEKSGGESITVQWKVGNGSKVGIPKNKISYFPTGQVTVNALSAPSTPGNPTPASGAIVLEPATVVNNTTNKLRVKLTWSQSNTTNIIGYEVYRFKTSGNSLPSGSVYTKIAEIPFVLNSYTYRDSVDLSNPDGRGFLEPGKYYWYKVRAKSINSYSGFWDPGKIQIPNTGTTNITTINVPVTPTSVVANPLSNSVINLTWSNGTSANLSGVEIWRASASAGVYNLVGRSKLNATTFNDSTCLAKVTYYYMLKSYNARAHSAFSAVASATTLNIPNIPANLVATSIGANHIALSWTVTDDQALGFKIFRALSSGGAYSMIDSLANPLLTSYQDKALTANTTYYYKIKAYNRNDNGTQNESGFSVIASATTLKSLDVDDTDWHLPIVAGSFASTFTNKKGNAPNKLKMATSLETKEDFLNMMHIDSTLNNPVTFSFQMPAATAFPNNAMLIYNLGYSKVIKEFYPGGVTVDKNDSTTIVDGSEFLQNITVNVYISSTSNFAVRDTLPATYTWKSKRNYDLQKITLPVSFVKKNNTTVNLGDKFIRVEIIVKSSSSTTNQSVWLSEVGLYKFLAPGTRHNYFLLLGASFEEQLPGMGLTMFRKKLSTYPELKDKGKNIVLFNLAVSGSATANLADSIDSYLNRHPNATYVFIHQGGNNINNGFNNMRPLTFNRLSSANCLSLVEDLKYFVSTTFAKNKVPFVSRLHFRDYKDGSCSGIAANDPVVKGGLYQENGSLPINLLIDSLTKVHMPYMYSEDEKRNLMNYYPVTLNEQKILGGDGIHPQASHRDTLCRYWINYGIRYVYTGSFATPLIYSPGNTPGVNTGNIGCSPNQYTPKNKPNLLTLAANAVELAKNTKRGTDIWEARILVEQIGDKTIRVPLVKSLDSLRDFRSPSNPLDLVGGAIDNTSVQLDWLDLNSIESGFEVYRAANGGDFSLVTTLPPNTITYLDNGLDATNEYTYYLRAINGSFKSGRSNQVRIRPSVSYYLKSSGDIASLSSWGRNFDGTGNVPVNFAGAGQTFVIANRNGIVELNSSLAINGNFSKLILLDGQSFKINSGVSYLGSLEVNDNAKLYVSGTNMPSITKVGTGSTLVLGNSYTLPNSIAWSNVELTGSTLTFATDTTKIQGYLKLGSGASLQGNNSVINLSGNLSSEDTLFAISSVGLNLVGTGQTLDFKSGTATFKSFKLANESTASLINSSKIKVTGTSAADKFVIGDNASLSIGTGQLILEGNIALNPSNETGYISTNGGTIKISSTSASASYLRLASANAQNYLEHLVLNNSLPATKLELKNALFIKNTLDLKSGTFKTNNLLVLLTDFENSSRILKIDANVTFQDSITYQNYVGPFKKQGSYNIGTPIKSRPMKEWKESFYIRTGMSGGTPVSYLRTYNEATNLWESIIDTATITTPGKGFNLYIPQATFNTDDAYSGVNYQNYGYPVIGNGSGSNNGFYNIAITKTTSNSGWNLLANPYPCELDWENATGWNKLDINNIVYFWDGNAGKYLSYDGNTHTSLNGATSKIPSGQGFFVRKSASGSGTLGLSENAKVGVKPDYRFYRVAQEELSKLFIMLTDGKSNGDETALVFGDDFLAEYDELDQEKLMGQSLNIYSIYGDNKLVLQCLPQKYSGTIPVGVGAAKGTFVMHFRDENLLSKLASLYLYDKYSNTTTDLLENPEYSFTVNASPESVGDGRFVLNYTFAQVVTGVDGQTRDLASIDVFPNPFSHHLMIHVKALKAEIGHIHIMNIEGEELYSGTQEFAMGENVIDAHKLLNFEQYGKGVYILKVVTDSKTVSTKLIYK